MNDIYREIGSRVSTCPYYRNENGHFTSSEMGMVTPHFTGDGDPKEGWVSRVSTSTYRRDGDGHFTLNEMGMLTPLSKDMVMNIDAL